MAKRRLSDQQQQRIQAAQRRRRERAQEALPSLEGSTEQLGLVVRHHGTFVDVEALPQVADDLAPERFPCHFRANIRDGLVAGDRVAWRSNPEGKGVVEAVLERTSLLARPDSRGILKPVAANIDFLVLVIAAEPTPSAALIDRYLVAARLQNLDAKIVLNKIDLADDDYLQILRELLEPYQACGYEVLEVSSLDGRGMRELETMLASHVSVFVGQSGVGKSSLVNGLLAHADTRVGDLSEHSRLGRHTTTNAQLFHFAQGGAVIDSPGIREFGLWHLDRDQIVHGFREFEPFLGLCRFSDCRHQQEPGCALKDAAAERRISEARLESFYALRESL